PDVDLGAGVEVVQLLHLALVDLVADADQHALDRVALAVLDLPRQLRRQPFDVVQVVEPAVGDEDVHGARRVLKAVNEIAHRRGQPRPQAEAVVVRTADLQITTLFLRVVANDLIGGAVVAGPVDDGGAAVSVEATGQVGDELARQSLDNVLGDLEVSAANG